MKSLRIHLITSSIFFSLVLFLWPVFMGLFMPAGTLSEQLAYIAKHTVGYKLEFSVAFLIAPAMLYLIWTQLVLFYDIHPVWVSLGKAFLTAYLILVSISYASQIFLVPVYIGHDDFSRATEWYFNAPYSIAYFLNQMGYFFWALGMLILFVPLLKKHGLIKFISGIYTLSALLSIMAFAGLLIDHSLLNSMTLFSGLVLAPIGILSIVFAIKKLE